MTWEEFFAARQVLAEERVGAPIRAHVRTQEEAEERQIEATQAAIRKTLPKAD